MSWLFLLGGIATEVVATMSLRASEGLTRKVWIIPVLLGYLFAFVFLSLALTEGLPLGVAYGIWAAAGVAITAALARIIFGEPLTRLMGLGIALIAIGVLVVEIGAEAAH